MKTLRPRLLRPTILGLSLGSLLLTTPVRADDQDTATHPEQPGFFQRLGHALFPPPHHRYYVRRRPLSYVDENGRVIPVDRPGTVVSSTAALGPNSTVVHAGDSTITLTNRAPGDPYADVDPNLAAPDYAGARPPVAAPLPTTRTTSALP